MEWALSLLKIGASREQKSDLGSSFTGKFDWPLASMILTLGSIVVGFNGTILIGLTSIAWFDLI